MRSGQALRTSSAFSTVRTRPHRRTATGRVGRRRVHELWCKNCDDSGAGGTTGAGFASTGSGAQCNDWDPSSAIRQSGGLLRIDETFYAEVLLDTSPLVFCDDAWWFQASGGFELMSASPGDLFYELGLRNGDRPLSIAGFPLRSLDDVGIAFAALKNRTGEPLTLEVSRNNSTISLTYQIGF